MEPQHKDDGEREFAERVLSVLTGRLPVPEEVYRITTAQLQRDRQRRRQQREGAEAAEEGGEVEEEEEEEEQAGDDRLYIKDRSLCGSARQRELVVQYLQWVLLRELALPAAAIERQSWTKHFNDGLALRLTNLVVSFPGLQQLDSSADDAPAPERPGDIVVGAHHDVQNNMSHCWMPSESTRSSAKDLRGHHDHHHHQDHDDEVKQGEEEGEGGGDADEYVVTAGADDNGSGVVGCLVLVRRLARQTRDPSEAGWRPRHTIRVALFDGEEPGLRCSLTEGSAEFVRRSTVKGAERFVFFGTECPAVAGPDGSLLMTTRNTTHTSADRSTLPW
jgi:hypothetical protein